jgi:hypothetical protein
MLVTTLRHQASQPIRQASRWKVAIMVRQENSSQGSPGESSPTPTADASRSQVTVDAFYALLEDVDLDEAFEEFIVPAKPQS